MSAKKRARAGSTQTFSISVDSETKKTLKKLAEDGHGGNVSALIAAWAARARREEAADWLWARSGLPEPTPEEIAKTMAELEEGWRHWREHGRKRVKRTKGKRAA